MQSLLQAGDVCVQDKRNHACLLDGARLSGCELRRYPHRDAEAAMRQLMGARDGAAMVATDGVFSMDGDLAPLRDLAMLARSQDALLFVDDAHGIGVIGPEGRGSLGVANLGAAEVPLLVLPLGKAFGGQGALLLGSDALVGHIAETARPYLFSTAAPAAMAAAMRASLRLIRGEPWRRARLASLMMRFRRTALRAGVPLLESYTPIQPVMLGSNERAVAASAALQARGFLVGAIRPPSVAEGQSRLRVTLNVQHTDAEVDALVRALAETCQPLETASA
jgi:8-amino-7-oxononanoate synthase